jgi:hypothetical protein
MRNRFLACVPGLLVAASLVLGEPPQGPAPGAPPLPAPNPLPTPGGPEKETVPFKVGAETLSPENTKAGTEGTSKPAPEASTETAAAPPQQGLFGDFNACVAGACALTNGNVLSANVEYLFWVLKNPRIPVLASTSALDDSANSVLIGGEELPYNHVPSSGARVTLSYWLADPQPELDWDRPRTWGVEVNFMDLGRRGLAMSNDTGGLVVVTPASGTTPAVTQRMLVRPFFSLNSNSETFETVASQGVAGGSVVVNSDSELWGTEINFLKNAYYEYPGKSVRIDFLAGFRYLDLGEGLSINSVTIPTQAPDAGTQLLVNDTFNTRNQFYGGQIGAVTKFFLDAVDLTVGFKLGLGNNAQEIHIEGSQSENGRFISTNGGLLALPSNSGRFQANQFCFVPEVDVLAHYQICRHLSVEAGYTFLAMSSVVRPGSQIDPVIDVTQIPNFPANGAVPTGVARPSVPFKQSTYWAQGMTVGMEFAW